MRGLLLVALALVVGCTPAEEPATDVVAEDDALAAASSFGGEWSVEALNVMEDSVLTTLRLRASDDTSGWALLFDHLDAPVPANLVLIEGDSATATFGPFDSALREGVIVNDLSVMVAHAGDGLSGSFQAVYEDGQVTDGRVRGQR